MFEAVHCSAWLGGCCSAEPVMGITAVSWLLVVLSITKGGMFLQDSERVGGNVQSGLVGMSDWERLT